MNIWTSLDEKESAAVDTLRKQLKELTDVSGIEYKYYFKLHPSSIGQTIKFCCDELNIEKDVTNYTNW